MNKARNKSEAGIERCTHEEVLPGVGEASDGGAVDHAVVRRPRHDLARDAGSENK